MTFNELADICYQEQDENSHLAKLEFIILMNMGE